MIPFLKPTLVRPDGYSVSLEEPPSFFGDLHLHRQLSNHPLQFGNTLALLAVLLQDSHERGDATQDERHLSEELRHNKLACKALLYECTLGEA